MLVSVISLLKILLGRLMCMPFFDNLLTSIYNYQNEGVIFICGDFYCRCGDLDDFIAGVDKVPQRKVIDFKTNSYGEVLVDFLINTNFCILNGINCLTNDFTSVSGKGLSVVDYCFVSHETLSSFSDFEVIHTSELISRIDNVGVVAPTGIPDHSLLARKIDLGSNFVNTSDEENLQSDQPVDKFDVRTVPDHFLSSPDILRNVNNVISSFASSLRTQKDIDSACNDWCHIVKANMYYNLPYKTIFTGVSNKRCKIGKPWWSDRLTNLWNDICIAEWSWLRCDEKHSKSVKKSNYEGCSRNTRKSPVTFLVIHAFC